MLFLDSLMCCIHKHIFMEHFHMHLFEFEKKFIYLSNYIVIVLSTGPASLWYAFMSWSFKTKNIVISHHIYGKSNWCQAEKFYWINSVKQQLGWFFHIKGSTWHPTESKMNTKLKYSKKLVLFPCCNTVTNVSYFCSN